MQGIGKSWKFLNGGMCLEGGFFFCVIFLILISKTCLSDVERGYSEMLDESCFYLPI